MDDGLGVAEGDYACLSDLFYRGDAARSATDEGNGIGLAVAALAMGRMGARLARAARRPGLRVELRFPPCSNTGLGDVPKGSGDGEGETHGADTYR